VNSLVLYHAGHGDMMVRPDIEALDGQTVRFTDGSSAEYDMILAATGSSSTTRSSRAIS
jgi:hypothetical protein